MKFGILTVFFIATAATAFGYDRTSASASQSLTNTITTNGAALLQARPTLRRRPTRCRPGFFRNQSTLGERAGKNVSTNAAAAGQTRRKRRLRISGNTAFLGEKQRTLRESKQHTSTTANAAVLGQQCKPQRPASGTKPGPKPKPFGPKTKTYGEVIETGETPYAVSMESSGNGKYSKPTQEKTFGGCTIVRMNKHLSRHSLTATVNSYPNVPKARSQKNTGSPQTRPDKARSGSGGVN